MNSPFSRRVAVSLTLLLGLVCMAPSRAQTLLADKPIAAGADVPGNLALALSVEYPTAISIANIKDYSDTTQYLGYFDAAKCYTYQFNSTTPANSFFKPTSIAAGSPGHDCSGTAEQWSGNFMNWATMQTIDPFRWALTGGYRSQDDVGLTILEKAWGSSDGNATQNYPYRGTSQPTGNNPSLGTGNRLSTSGSLIAKLTPFSSWSKFDLGIWGNGNAMVFSGDGATTSYHKATALATDLSNINGTGGANSTPARAYRVYVRVSVCDPSLGVANLESNCVKYGSSYKPEGLLQQYSQKIRFSAFGYLTQDGLNREGGVMRAPMGFIGPNVPQPLTTTLLTNPRPEWSSTDGTMIRNPDTVSASAGGGVLDSGVMNYLNKFGESAHFYKTHDNVSELYYAAVRYFENLGNVAEWTNGDGAYLDGFPALTVWPTGTTGTNPRASILYSCQKNFILGIGDDHTWYDYDVGGSTYAGPGGRAMPAAVRADTFNQASAWTTALQNIEGITPTPVWPNLAGATYFIAGLAYGVHVNDIRPDLANAQTISTYWMDVAENQRLENLNPYYLASKYGGFNAGTIPQGPPGFTNPGPPSTTNPPAYDMTNAAAITQATYDSTGLTTPMVSVNPPLPDNYYNAGNAGAMVAGLKAAFISISSSISQLSTSFSFSAPNVSSGTLSFGASFDADGWGGTVIGSTLTFLANGDPDPHPAWCTSVCTPAAPVMNTLQTQLSGTGWQTGRVVTTWSGTSGVPFEFTSLTIAQQAALRPSYATSGNATTDETNYLNYLRGDRTNEVASTISTSTHAFRNRKVLLGDIVDAGLTPVSTPQQTFSDLNNPGYTFFKTNWTTTTPRPTMVYAGANDGMLHGFDGTTGHEQFAYVPSALFQGPNGTPQVDGLAQLGNPNYIHHNYVDATPAAFDIDMSRTVGSTGTPDYTQASTTPWRTVLIGGLGKGGNSFYALDITDPTNMNTESAVAGKVLWEYPNNLNPDIASNAPPGYSYGVPVVVKTVKYGWVAIVTSGYNNADQYGYLYIINPRTGARLETIKTPSQSIGLTQASAFVKDFSDETTDSVYVGDLQGQVWRFDLREPLPANAYPPPVLLATVTSPTDGLPQPITTAPLIEIHPVTRKRYVMFGTGALLAVPDLPNTQEQSFYAIVDGTASGFNPISAPITRANLTAITSAQIGGTTSALGVISAPTPNPLSPTSLGWYTDLGRDIPAPPGSGIGWRVLLNPQAFNGVVTFATSLTTATDPCSPQGSSRVYALDYATVDSVLQPSVAGAVVPSFDTYGVAAINLRFAGANGVPEIVVGFTNGLPEKVPANLTNTLATRILNWREIPTVE
jgi:type IV pilus assembly protein PilY1